MTSAAELITQLSAIKDKIRNESGQAMDVFFAEFFAKYPEIEKIEWSQYTPYFNDGDTCEFGLHGAEYLLRKEFADQKGIRHCSEFSEDDEHEGFVGISQWSLGYQQRKEVTEPTPEYTEAVDRLKQAMSEFEDLFSQGEELFLYAYGDHVRCTATVNGVDTERYDHD